MGGVVTIDKDAFTSIKRGAAQYWRDKVYFNNDGV